MFTTFAAVIFFSLKKRGTRKDMTYETLLSACYTDGQLHQRLEMASGFLWQNRKSSPAPAQLCHRKGLPLPPPFLWLHCELCKASCKEASLPSQAGAKKGREMDALWVCYYLHTSLVESYPFSEPGPSQLTMQGTEEQDPVMF